MLTIIHLAKTPFVNMSSISVNFDPSCRFHPCEWYFHPCQWEISSIHTKLRTRVGRGGSGHCNFLVSLCVSCFVFVSWRDRRDHRRPAGRPVRLCCKYGDGWGRRGGAAQNELLEAELKERARDFEGDLRKKLGFKISLACRRRSGAADLIAGGRYGGRTCANNCWYGMERENRCVERGVTMADDGRASGGLQRGSCETGQVVLLWRIPFTAGPLVRELLLLLASFATPWSRAPYSSL